MPSGDLDLERVRGGYNPGGVVSSPRVPRFTSWNLAGIGPATESTLGEPPASNRAWSIANRSALTLMRTPSPVPPIPGIPGWAGGGAQKP